MDSFEEKARRLVANHYIRSLEIGGHDPATAAKVREMLESGDVKSASTWAQMNIRITDEGKSKYARKALDEYRVHGRVRPNVCTDCGGKIGLADVEGQYSGECKGCRWEHQKRAESYQSGSADYEARHGRQTRI